MDINPFFPALFDVLQWVIPLSWLLMLVVSPLFKGMLGELLLYLSTTFRLDDEIYQSFSNVLLPLEDGDAGSAIRIDEVIVSRFGIFLVETNTLQGRIYGGRKQRTWRHKLGVAVEPFESPRRLGFRHVKAIAKALGLGENRFFPLVVFVGDSEFRSPMPKNVIHGDGFIPYIQSQQEELLSEDEVRQAVARIESMRLHPARRDWLAFGKHLVGMDEAKPAETVCPRCGGAMVLRSSKKFDELGKEFWGCVAFPKCRGTVEATQVQLPRTKSLLLPGSGGGIQPSSP